MKSPAPNRRQALLALAASTLVARHAHAIDDDRLRDARDLFQRAAGGETALAEPAAERWLALSAAAPQDAVRRAYAGAATTMRARATVWPWRKLAHVDDGSAQLDKALAQLTPAHDRAAPGDVPPSLEVRFVAASTFLSLPAMFKRGARGAQLLDEVLASPLLAATPAAFQAQVWLRAGRHAADEGRPADARRWFEKARASGTPAAAAAQAALEAL